MQSFLDPKGDMIPRLPSDWVQMNVNTCARAGATTVATCPQHYWGFGECAVINEISLNTVKQ